MRKLGLATLACLACLVVAAQAHAAKAPKLLAKYQPVTVFHPNEAFRPTSAEGFIADSRLEALTAPGTWTVVDPAPTPATLPTRSPPIWRLNQRECFAGAGPAAVPCYVRSSAGERSVVYGRVVEDGRATVLQYWYFYTYNLYSYPFLPPGVLWQAHEGDWEVVNVVLSPTGGPRYVGYSQHCDGEVRTWAQTPRRKGHHPIVYVALGSHANYFRPGLHAIDVDCLARVPGLLDFFRATRLPLPADVAGEGDVAGPRRLGGEVTAIERVPSPSAPWLAFPGFWGELQYFGAPPPTGTVPVGTSPVGPAFHAVWREPLATLADWASD